MAFIVNATNLKKAKDTRPHLWKVKIIPTQYIKAITVLNKTREQTLSWAEIRMPPGLVIKLYAKLEINNIPIITDLSYWDPSQQ